ncbi:MAG: ligase-associated DNA damage response exonuclease [Hyphomicrobiaceae bacterium]|nr:ligase-associated DNA damage response exonuclease [Hyphomicrobiaceae bacterium]
MLEFTDRGIYCPAADIYIDPWKPVERAVITHGHSDHARAGHAHYLSTAAAAPVIRHRLGEIDIETVAFGEVRTINGVSVSLHPAGHIPGSAQVRLEHRGKVWVVSGDYKTVPDGLSEPFEPLRCDTFISECTFGLPAFKWRPQADVMADINSWWANNAQAGRVSVIGAYSLGKAQRLIANVDTSIGPLMTHGAVEAINGVLRAQGIELPSTTRVVADMEKSAFARALVIAPPSALGSSWLRKFGDVSTAFASGWMALRGVRRRRSSDRGFILSDHVDWPELNSAIDATGARRVFVTHGYTHTFRRWLEERGFEAHIVDTEYSGEQLDGEGTGPGDAEPSEATETSQ